MNWIQILQYCNVYSLTKLTVFTICVFISSPYLMSWTLLILQLNFFFVPGPDKLNTYIFCSMIKLIIQRPLVSITTGSYCWQYVIVVPTCHTDIYVLILIPPIVDWKVTDSWLIVDKYPSDTIEWYISNQIKTVRTWLTHSCYAADTCNWHSGST